MIESKVQGILQNGRGIALPLVLRSEALLRRVEEVPVHVYLDIAENIVRQATEWQAPDGMVGDPYNEKGVESITATARYTAAMGHLIRAGRCLDLLDNAMRAMDWCCGQLTAHHLQGKKWPAANFNLKDMMVLYEALRPWRELAQRPQAPADRFRRWTEQIKAPAPEKIYDGERNWVFYGTAAEAMRIKHGLSDGVAFIDKALEGQMAWWTSHGMYRDPNDPVTYDLTVRQGLAFMLEAGYDGRYAQWARDTLRKGALTNLLFVSPTGVAPYGGRSNQFHIMEGMIAYLAEWQAKQEAKAGNVRLAGALRRMALAGAGAVARWALQKPYRSLKNEMTEHPFFGQDGYTAGQNAHSGYGLLAANLFAGAYHVADHSIAVGPSPADIGGYVLYLPDAFYRVWATVGPYHIQIDTRGQPGQDATGLGRIHRRGVPIETGLNMSIVSAPSYIVPTEKARRSVALGVGWPCEGGWRYLSEASRETHDVEVTVRSEGNDLVDFVVAYTGRGDGLRGVAAVQEQYSLSREGLRCVIEAPGATRLRLQVPVIVTDGRLKSEMAVGAGGVEVKYSGHVYLVRVPDCCERGIVEPWPAPNRNGIYSVVVFEVEGPRIAYEATLQ